MNASHLLPQLRPGVPIYHAAALAPVVAIGDSGAYESAAYVIPDAQNASIPARGVVETRLSVPVGTYVYGFQGFSTQAAGFEIQILDARHGAPWWQQPVDYRNASSQAAGPLNCRFPFALFPQPRLVIEPGLLSVRLRNNASVANTVEVVLFCLIPLEATR